MCMANPSWEEGWTIFLIHKSLSFCAALSKGGLSLVDLI